MIMTLGRNEASSNPDILMDLAQTQPISVSTKILSPLPMVKMWK